MAKIQVKKEITQEFAEFVDVKIHLNNENTLYLEVLN